MIAPELPAYLGPGGIDCTDLPGAMWIAAQEDATRAGAGGTRGKVLINLLRELRRHMNGRDLPRDRVPAIIVHV
jgi:hypothetical protein